MNKKLPVFSVLYFVIQVLTAQNQEIAGPPLQAVHNTSKYNRFLFNPAFSFNQKAAESGDKNGYISIYGRLEKVDFVDAPRNLNATYSKTFNEKMSYGVGVFQQNIGAISHFGGVLNYIYNVEFNRDTYMAFGANVSYQRAGLKSDIRTVDPVENSLILGEFDDTSLLRVSPGFNINYRNFDFGLVARNIVSASIGGNENLYKSNTVVVHGMYSRPLARRSPNTVRGMLYVEKETQVDAVFGLNGFIENEKYGFAQLGYNTTYGVSLGLGFNITPQATIGYTIERGLGAADIFGLNHEFTLAYNFVEPQRGARRKSPSKPKSSRKLPERNEISKAEKLLALQTARDQQANNNLAALQEAKAKAELLRDSKRQDDDEKNKASELVRTVSLQIDDNDLEKAKATLDRIKNSKYISNEDKAALLAKYTKKVEIAQDIEAEEIRIAEETKSKEKARALLARTTKLINDKNSIDAEATLELIRSSKYISEEEKRQIVSSLKRLKQEKEAVALQEENMRKGAELVRTTSLLLDEESITAADAQDKINEISENQFIPQEDKTKILSQLKRFLVKQEEVAEDDQKQAQLLEAARLVEQQRLEDEVLQKVEQARLEAEAQVAEVTRLELEEANKAAFVSETESIASTGSLEDVKARASLVRTSKLIPEEEKQRILSSLTRVIETKEADKASFVSETESIASTGSLEDIKARASLVRTSKLIPEEEKQRILSSLTRVIETREADKASFVSETESIASTGSLEDVKARASLVRTSKLVPEEEKQRILSSLTRIIETKEADKATFVSETESIASTGSLEDIKARASLVRTSKLVPEEEKQRILSSLTRIIETKEADVKEAARLAEEARIAEAERKAAEAARLAEEARIAEAERKAAEAARLAEEARIAEAERKAAEAARLAEEARIAEAERKAAEAARLAEEARIAEAERKAAEAARLAEDERLAREAELARIAEEERLAKEAEEAGKRKATIVRTTSLKEEVENRKKAELVRVKKLISDEEQKEERRRQVQAALKRTTKKVEKEETQRGSTLKRTLLPQN